ncbi:radical SAM protein [Salinarimonas sp.]|uniref:radical SAM protein n=1 Tax=Salinarimonas sp. TaxID=2766526 RepID=UPI00391BCF82
MNTAKTAAPVPVFSLNFPLFANWYITGKCNLRCTHCYLTDYTKDAPLETVLRIIDYVAKNGMRNMSFLGGEPLVRQDFEQIVAACKSAGMGTKLATNGVLIDAKRAARLKAAGLDKAQISLEEHSPELSDPVRGEGTFDAALAGIELLKREGIWTAISLVLSHQNVPHLETIYSRAAEVGVRQLKLAAFVPVGTGLAAAPEFMLTEADVEEVKARLPALRKRYPHVALNSAFSPRREHPKETCGTFGCGAGTHTIVINNDLSISACDLLTEEDRSKERIEEPEDIGRIWREHALFRKWRREAPGSTRTVGDFSQVHAQGCHVAFSTYGRNMLAER